MSGNGFMKRVLVLVAVTGMLAVVARAADENDKPDVVGTWTLKYDPGNGETREPELKVIKEGARYKVVFTEGERKLTAKDVQFSDGKLRFKIDTEHEGEKASVKFEGKVKGDTIEGEGKWEFQGMTGDFPFMGKRKEAKPKN